MVFFVTKKYPMRSMGSILVNHNPQVLWSNFGNGQHVYFLLQHSLKNYWSNKKTIDKDINSCEKRSIWSSNSNTKNVK